MLKEAVDTYLAVRRATGFKLQDDAWAGLARSESQRAARLKAVIRFARFSRAADDRHELPPQGVFSPQRHRPVPVAT